MAEIARSDMGPSLYVGDWYVLQRVQLTLGRILRLGGQIFEQAKGVRILNTRARAVVVGAARI